VRTSIATVSLSGPLGEKLEAAAAAGFDAVEIFEDDLIASPLTPERIRERAADLGLSIDLYQPFRDFETDDPELLAANLRRAAHKFELMHRLGTDLMLVCSSVHPTAPAEDARTAEQLRLLGDSAARHGVRIAYEALAWGRRVNTYPHSWRLVRQADHPAVGICLDSFHILSRGDDPAGIADIPGDKIFFLQLADAPALSMDVLQWSRHHRCFPGQGGLDVAGVLRETLAAGYRGPLSLEVFNDTIRQAEPAATATDALRSLIALDDGNSGGDSGPAPADVSPTGIAFAEIAAADPAPLGTLLSALGMHRVGRHRHGKPVELWEHGEARILLNREGADRRSGPALTALGLETPDPGAAAERAERLRAPVVPRRRAPGDAELDAVEAPDGTQVFFCDSGRADGWRADFGAPEVAADTPSEPVPGAVTRVDHLSLAPPPLRFDEAVLFHRTVLGLRPGPGIELADPYGLVRSRALSGAGGAPPRLALNARPDTADRPPRQHLALATGDIAATARRLREAGIPLLPVPANYHEDLTARHGLGEAELAPLREFGLLYDRDAGGEFRQLYVAGFGRVLIEIVQRDDGYLGYGARNAGVRLAAQAARIN
jgi:4-hydroxyphenylpyruvate dioxygenase